MNLILFAVLIVFFTLSIFSVFLSIKTYRKIIKANEEKKVIDIVQSLLTHGKCQSVLHNICKQLNANRAFVIKCHNGGDLPSVDKPLKITIVNEWSDLNLPYLQPNFQNRQVDGGYIQEVILPILIKGRVRLDTEDLKNKSFLKDTLKAQKIKVSETWRLGIDSKEKSMYYFAIHWLIDDKITIYNDGFNKFFEDTPESRTELNNVKMTLLDIFKNIEPLSISNIDETLILDIGNKNSVIHDI